MELREKIARELCEIRFNSVSSSIDVFDNTHESTVYREFKMEFLETAECLILAFPSLNQDNKMTDTPMTQDERDTLNLKALLNGIDFSLLSDALDYARCNAICDEERMADQIQRFNALEAVLRGE